MRKLILTLLIALTGVVPAWASIPSLPWSTTFNCGDWDQADGLSVAAMNCDGMSGMLDSWCEGVTGSSISSSSNYPGGGGGGGFRQYSSDNDGSDLSVASKSTGLGVVLDQGYNEIWLRMYIRFEAGFERVRAGYHKLFYIWDTVDRQSGSDYFGSQSSSNNNFGIGRSVQYGDYGFDDMYGDTSDGSWHHFEMHINISGHVFQYWVDGVLRHTNNGATYNMTAVRFIQILSNMKNTLTGNDCKYIDIDDIAISNAGYIGPIGTADATPPVIGTPSPSGSVECTESGGTQTTTISAQVQDATPPIDCEAGATSGFSFGTGTVMSPSAGGSGVTYTADFSDQCGQSYTRYIKCQDSLGNTSATGTAVSYTIGSYAGDNNAPATGSVSPSSGSELTCVSGSRDVTVQAINVTDASPPIQVKISPIDNFDFATQGTLMTPGGTGASGETHAYVLSGLSCDSAYTYYIKARDDAGNVSSQTAVNFSIAAQPAAELLLHEAFEDSSFASRGWYDGIPTSVAIASNGVSGNCAKFTFAQGASTPTGWQTIRHAISQSDELTYTFWLFLPNEWVGSGLSYQPHFMHTLSDLDSQYSGPSANYLNFYIEFNGTSPRLAIQDALNVNQYLGTLPNNITATTEDRSVNYCNGYLAGQDQGDARDCLNLGGGTYYSATDWFSSLNMTRGVWHEISAYVRLNSIVSGVAVPNGALEYTVDGQTAIASTTAVMRTGQNPTMGLAQVLLAPYMSDGSPVAQTFYLDELNVYRGRLDTTTPPEPPPAPGETTVGISNINSGAIGFSSPGSIPMTVYGD